MCRSLISSFRITAKTRREWRYPENEQPYPVVVGADVVVPVDVKPDDAADAVSRCMSPAPDQMLKAWMVRLQAACAQRPGSEASAAAQYTLYVSELRKYPADVAKASCERLMRGKPGEGTRWFPTLGEVIDICEDLVLERRMILESLQDRQQPVIAPKETRRAFVGKPASDKNAVNRMLEEYNAKMTDYRASRPTPPQLPAMSGRVDETGITAEMRVSLAKRR